MAQGQEPPKMAWVEWRPNAAVTTQRLEKPEFKASRQLATPDTSEKLRWEEPLKITQVPPNRQTFQLVSGWFQDVFPISGFQEDFQLPSWSDEMTPTERFLMRNAVRLRQQEIPFKHWNAVLENHPHVESDIWVFDGRPIIRDTRISVSTVIGYLTLGGGKKALLKDYPSLNDQVIQDAVDFVLDLLNG